ncbi:thioredoxin family protein [Pontibacter sp. 13R65]|uniref:thioredoxin family protein n=1 Tax=Pontibacter sp. 13R65 TaxID=3127458 RepID=UPI00301E3A13
MKAQYYLLLFFIFLALVCKGQSNGITFETANWESVLQKAKQERKPVFLYAYTPSCGSCRQMEKEVFTNPEAVSYYNYTFVNYKINIEDGSEGEALAAKYAIVGFPTYLFFDKNGTLLHQSGSAKSAPDFILDGKNAFNPRTALFTLKRKYDKGGRSARFLYDYSQALSTFHQADSPEEVVVAQYLKTQSTRQLSSEKNLRFIFTRYLDLNASATQYFLLNQQKFLPYFPDDEIAQKAQQIIRRAAHKAGHENDTLLFKNIQGLISSAIYDTSRLSSLAKIYFFGGQGNWPKYAAETWAYAKGEGGADWITLHETAAYLHHFAKEKEALQVGAAIMARVVDLEKSYDNLLLLARLLTKTGKNAAAIEAAGEAITVAKLTGEDTRDAEKLVSRLNEK